MSHWDLYRVIASSVIAVLWEAFSWSLNEKTKRAEVQRSQGPCSRWYTKMWQGWETNSSLSGLTLSRSKDVMTMDCRRKQSPQVQVYWWPALCCCQGPRIEDGFTSQSLLLVRVWCFVFHFGWMFKVNTGRPGGCLSWGPDTSKGNGQCWLTA
jgi:hypothetical protein